MLRGVRPGVQCPRNHFIDSGGTQARHVSRQVSAGGAQIERLSPGVPISVCQNGRAIGMTTQMQIG